MSEMNAPAPVTESAPAAESFATLQSDTNWQSAFNGEQGRPAQKEAVAAKTAALKADAGHTDPAPEPPPAGLADALASPSEAERNVAEGLAPETDAGAFSNHLWSDTAEVTADELSARNSAIGEAVVATGANAHYARATIDMLDQAVTRADPAAAPHTVDGLMKAVTKSYGDQADATLALAKFTVAAMPAATQDWLHATLERVDPSTFAWTVGRLATVARTKQ
jgi:hypothetical protein